MQPGEHISPNLRLVRQLGQGGMGSVWAAHHETLGTDVAVKIMTRAYTADTQLTERFRREAAAVLKLKSPHVAQVFDHGVTADGTPFIVMELLEGEDLGKRIERMGPMPLALAVEIATQVSRALSRAHSQGVIHRDIKAENVFLTDHDGDLLVKVLDFGIAKVDSGPELSMTATQGTFGTPLYMSPEQLLSAKKVDHRTDLWALAVLVYFMLTGDYPFVGDTIGAISVAVHTGQFAPARSYRADLPIAVDAWFSRMFQKDPNARYANAKEMIEALRTAFGLGASPLSPVSTADTNSQSSLDPTVDMNVSQLPQGLIAQPAAVGGISSPFLRASSDAAPQITLSGATVLNPQKERPRWLMPVIGGFVLIAVAAVTMLALGKNDPKVADSAVPTADAPPASSPIVTASIQSSAATPGTASTSAQATGSAQPSVSPAITATSRTSVPPKPSGTVTRTGTKTKKDDIGF
ncbi:MAG: protein kinase [Polyangiaceae bacterium]|nr:protein kinase [Polyangiaceae bacterium]